MANDTLPAEGLSVNQRRDPLRRLAFVGVGVIIALALVWWIFIRTTWDPILSNVEPGDAADAVKVLEAKKIDYRLTDQGRTISVPSDAADQARVELVGSELPMRGQVGFELFNESDMGLTEFAQKINYQRALQGELARTILTLDGISSVRVHLALPDRGIFREDRSSPRASVTLMLRPGHSLTEASVRGVQLLISGAIPDMSPDAVAVLDGEGRVVSSSSAAGVPASNSDAIVQNWQRLIDEAIRAAHPALRFSAGVSLRYRPHPSDLVAGSPPSYQPTQSARDVAPRGDPDYALAVRITTAAPLDEKLRADVSRVVNAAAGINSARGDSIVFLTGPLVPPVTAEVAATNRVVYRATAPAAPSDRDWANFAWPLAILIGCSLLFMAWWSDRRRTRAISRVDLNGFANTLRERLSMADTAL